MSSSSESPLNPRNAAVTRMLYHLPRRQAESTLRNLARAAVQGLRRGELTIEEAEATVFNLDTLELCRDHLHNSDLRELVEHGMELEDIRDLVEEDRAFHRALDQIEQCVDQSGRRRRTKPVASSR